MTVETLIIIDAASLILQNGALNHSLITHFQHVSFDSHEIVILTRTINAAIENHLVDLMCEATIDVAMFESMLDQSAMPVLLNKIHNIDIENLPTMTSKMPTLFETHIMDALNLTHYKKIENILFISHSDILCDAYSISSHIKSMRLPPPQDSGLIIDDTGIKHISKEASLIFKKVIVHVDLDNTLLNLEQSIEKQSVTLNIAIIKKLKEIKRIFPDALLRISTSRINPENSQAEPRYVSADAAVMLALLKYELTINIDADSYRGITNYQAPTCSINWKWRGFENEELVLNILIDDNEREILQARQQKHLKCKIITIPVYRHTIQPMPNHELFDRMVSGQLGPT